MGMGAFAGGEAAGAWVGTGEAAEEAEGEPAREAAESVFRFLLVGGRPLAAESERLYQEPCHGQAQASARMISLSRGYPKGVQERKVAGPGVPGSGAW